MVMVWTWLLLLPCSLAFKEYATSRSVPIEYTIQPTIIVALSDLSVPVPWTDWSISAWIYFVGGSDANVLITNPAHKLEVTGGKLVMSGDNINAQTKTLMMAHNGWQMMIFGSNQIDSYAFFASRNAPGLTLTTQGLNTGVPAPLQPTTTFEVRPLSPVLSVRVM